MSKRSENHSSEDSDQTTYVTVGRRKIIGLSLIEQSEKQDRYVIDVIDIDPITRIKRSPEMGAKKLWDGFCENLHGMLNLAHFNGTYRPDIFMPASLAVAFDGQMRSVVGYECGVTPKCDPNDPDKKYIYKY